MHDTALTPLTQAQEQEGPSSSEVVAQRLISLLEELRSSSSRLISRWATTSLLDGPSCSCAWVRGVSAVSCIADTPFTYVIFVLKGLSSFFARCATRFPI